MITEQDTVDGDIRQKVLLHHFFIQIGRYREVKDSITFYWTADGHYVNVDLEIEDENRMTGTLMGMFPVIADRVVE